MGILLSPRGPGPRDRTYESEDRILRQGYFCNTDRRWDFTSEEQEYEVSVAPRYRREAIETVIAQRMSGSARHSEKPGKSGTYPSCARRSKGSGR